MGIIGRIAGFINRHLIAFTIGVAVLALLMPGAFMPIASIKVGQFSTTSFMIMLIMLGNGMTIDVSALRDMVRRPGVIGIGLVVKYAAMAGGAYLVARLFAFDPQIAFGLILLGCMPSGTASGIFISIAKGDVALCMTIVLLSTFLAPVVTPALTFLLGGEWVTIDFMSMFWSILFTVLVPMVVGIVLRNRRTAFCDSMRPLISLVSIIALLTVVVVCAAPNASSILSVDSVVVVVGLCVVFLIAFGAAFACVRMMRLDYERSQAIIIATADLNTGLASGIAATFAAVYPLAVIPAIIYIPVNIFLVTLVVKIVSRKAGIDTATVTDAA